MTAIVMKKVPTIVAIYKHHQGAGSRLSQNDISQSSFQILVELVSCGTSFFVWFQTWCLRDSPPRLCGFTTDVIEPTA